MPCGDIKQSWPSAADHRGVTVHSSDTWTHSTQPEYTHAGMSSCVLLRNTISGLFFFVKTSNYPISACFQGTKNTRIQLKSESEHHAQMKLTSVALRLYSPSVKCVGIHMNSVPVSRMWILRDITRVPGSACLRALWASSSRVNSAPREKCYCFMKHTAVSDYLTLQMMYNSRAFDL